MAGNANFPGRAGQHSGRARLMLCSQHQAIKVMCWQRGSPTTQTSAPQCSTCRRSFLSIHQPQGVATVPFRTLCIMKLEEKLQEQFRSCKELLELAMVGSHCNYH